MKVTFNDKAFISDMNNLVQYSLGFVDGVQVGKQKFLNNFGQTVIETLKSYIDSNAKVDPQMLHHVYEWNSVGSPDARLYDLNYSISGFGISINSTFKQSNSVKNGSYEPFYNKAEIMENGIPITIRPKRANVLSFNVDGEQVFTKGPVKVETPGGQEVAGSYEKVFDSFFNRYFSQAFLIASGIIDYIEKPLAYKNSLPSGIRGGKSVGRKVGYQWIANAGVLRSV